MNTAQFLARVTPPGPFLAIGVNRTPGEKNGFMHRFFVEGDTASAASYLEWASGKGWDAYHAMASFRHADPDGADKRGTVKYRGSRVATNAHMLKAFWIDLDVKRPGDKKVDGQAYASAADAFAWVAGFRGSMGLPRPNLAVTSGYGVHLYWVLEDAMPAAGWQPYADAFKAALIAHKFQGDPGISADSARILRPPGTMNWKVKASPAPVADMPKLAAGDTVNALMLAALQPFVGVAAVGGARAGTSSAQTSGFAVLASQGTASALAGGGGVLRSGPPGSVQSIFANRAGTMTAAATANLFTNVRPRFMAKTAQGCGQVAQSLAVHGAQDPYPLWYLGHITLAHFCQDGADFVHPIGDGHAGYSPAGTDAAVAQAAAELAKNGKGPPSCSHYERCRPSVCQACPHYGKIKGPWDLGVDDADLPDHYRRSAPAAGPCLEYRTLDKEGEPRWHRLVSGDVSNPLLDWRPVGGHALTFDYKREGVTRTIYFVAAELGEDAAVLRLFEPQGVHLNPGTEKPWRTFVMAWIDKLITQRAARTEVVHPWGWATDAGNASNGGVSGFAVAGTLYRPDGRREPAPGGDAEMLAVFKPHGDLARWRTAFDFVTAGRPDLAALVACSFGAPLMRFTGHPGVVVSAWSKQSGVGKSAALTVAQGVWADQRAMFSLQDTPNSVLAKVARTRSMVTLWDETRIVTPEGGRAFSQMVFELTQGKERSRMRSDTSLRSVGTWETILVCAANKPLIDLLVAQDEGTEAGALRVFEFAITVKPLASNVRAAQTIALAKSNYGRAGEAYGQWLAAHIGQAEKLVTLIGADLERALAAEQSERLYVAGMATMLAGAAIASKLGIAMFDQKALRAFLEAEFLRLRAARRRDIVVSSAGYDLEQVLSLFMSDMARHKMVTNRFGRSGPKSIQIKWTPQDHSVLVQVSQSDRAMRFNRTTFYEWCRRRNLSGPDLVADMASQWGASTGRWILGAGTGFGGGQIWCVEIPLTRPELAGYATYDEEPTAVVVAGGTRRNGLASRPGKAV